MLSIADKVNYVSLPLGGKPITPTGEHQLLNGSHINESHEANGTTVVDSATKQEVRISPIYRKFI